MVLSEFHAKVTIFRWGIRMIFHKIAIVKLRVVGEQGAINYRGKGSLEFFYWIGSWNRWQMTNCLSRVTESLWKNAWSSAEIDFISILFQRCVQSIACNCISTAASKWAAQVVSAWYNWNRIGNLYWNCGGISGDRSFICKLKGKRGSNRSVRDWDSILESQYNRGTGNCCWTWKDAIVRSGCLGAFWEVNSSKGDRIVC